MSKTIKLLFLSCAIMVLAACSAGPKIYVNKDPKTDLGAFTTFGFEKNLATDKIDGTQSLLSQYFIATTKKEMELRGYKYTTENPELGINFYASTQEKIRSTSTPTMGMGMGMGGYYGYRGGYYAPYGGYETTVQQYTQGTATIDLVNMSTKKLVWEGTAVGRITTEVQENLQGSVTNVVKDIFQRYPTQQGGGPAYVPPKTKK